MSSPRYTHLPDGTPLPDLHDTEELWELSTGWLVCPTCEGGGWILFGEHKDATIECPDCNGTGDPPLRPKTSA